MATGLKMAPKAVYELQDSLDMSVYFWRHSGSTHERGRQNYCIFQAAERRWIVPNLVTPNWDEAGISDFSIIQALEQKVSATYIYSLEGMANCPGIPKGLLPPTVLYLSCDSELATERAVLLAFDVERSLARLGLHLYLQPLEDETLVDAEDWITKKESGSPGDGLATVYLRTKQVCTEVTQAILGERHIEQAPYEELEMIAGEVQFQMETFCQHNCYRWGFAFREDKEEMWQSNAILQG